MCETPHERPKSKDRVAQQAGLLNAPSTSRQRKQKDAFPRQTRQTVHTAVRCVPVCRSRNSCGNHRGTICSTCASLPSRTPATPPSNLPAIQRHPQSHDQNVHRGSGGTLCLGVLPIFSEESVGNQFPTGKGPGSFLPAGGHIHLVQNRQQRFKFIQAGIQKIR